ncbi:hypothetical protein ABZT51_43240 [Streptomyces sp. NPDC005373]|uniref:hypothetical protein n=1 Tax=Streptomyces sp. NPDC005373 TaxID=3156879 RepID=UPI0033AFAEF4
MTDEDFAACPFLDPDDVVQALRQKLAHLAGDVHRLWHDPDLPMRERKRGSWMAMEDVGVATAIWPSRTSSTS